MDDIELKMLLKLKTTRLDQEQREIMDFIHIGSGRFIRFKFQRRMNPTLVLLYSVHLVSAVVAIVIISLLNVELGVVILLLVTGLFTYLQSLIHPKFVRGWLLGEEVVTFPITEEVVAFPITEVNLSSKSRSDELSIDVERPSSSREKQARSDASILNILRRPPLRNS